MGVFEQLFGLVEEAKPGNGTVKWFSRQKGYGFIIGDDGIQYFFHISDVNGINIPDTGDRVQFKSIEGKKGPRGIDVTIVKKGERDDRVICPHCGRKMVPRVIVKKGKPVKSVCPFCGKTYKEFGPCILATTVLMATGKSEDCYELQVLRHFRDEYVKSLDIGETLISFYYKTAPEIIPLILGDPTRDEVIGSLYQKILKIVALIEQEHFDVALNESLATFYELLKRYAPNKSNELGNLFRGN